MALQLPPALQVPLAVVAVVLGVGLLVLAIGGPIAFGAYGGILTALVALLAGIRRWLPPGPPSGPLGAVVTV